MFYEYSVPFWDLAWPVIILSVVGLFSVAFFLVKIVDPWVDDAIDKYRGQKELAAKRYSFEKKQSNLNYNNLLQAYNGKHLAVESYFQEGPKWAE
jgi:lipopolysaccharide export LptBFGC system permease protein LptF